MKSEGENYTKFCYGNIFLPSFGRGWYVLVQAELRIENFPIGQQSPGPIGGGDSFRRFKQLWYGPVSGGGCTSHFCPFCPFFSKFFGFAFLRFFVISPFFTPVFVIFVPPRMNCWVVTSGVESPNFHDGRCGGMAWHGQLGPLHGCSRPFPQADDRGGLRRVWCGEMLRGLYSSPGTWLPLVRFSAPGLGHQKENDAASPPPPCLRGWPPGPYLPTWLRGSCCPGLGLPKNTIYYFSFFFYFFVNLLPSSAMWT